MISRQECLFDHRFWVYSSTTLRGNIVTRNYIVSFTEESEINDILKEFVNVGILDTEKGIFWHG